jgi:hypothetical protein
MHRREALIIAGLSFSGAVMLDGMARLVDNLRDNQDQPGHFEVKDQPVRTVAETSGIQIPIHNHWNTAADYLSNQMILRLLGYRTPARTEIARIASGVELLSLATIIGTLSSRYQDDELPSNLFYVFDRSIFSQSKRRIRLSGDIREEHLFFINSRYIEEIPALSRDMI